MMDGVEEKRKAVKKERWGRWQDDVPKRNE